MVLSNGVRIPWIGFGTGRSLQGDIEESVLCALRCGYRLIDTAFVYGSEQSVGNAIQRFLVECRGRVERSDLFIQTKFYPEMPYDAENMRTQFAQSLDALQTDYVDAYLIHQPVPRYGELEYQDRNADVWRAMEELYEKGYVRAVGVSNFLERHILQLEEGCHIRPMINQLEINPVFQQRGLARWCREHGMVVQSWGPLSCGGPDDKAAIERIARRHGASIAQVCIKWNAQMGNIPICASHCQEHIVNNFIPMSDLSEQEMEEIRSRNTCTEHRKTWWYPRQQMY